MECKCVCCNKIYQQKFDEKLEAQFFNTYRFSKYDNKFILLQQKGGYPYQYMDNQDKSNKTSSPKKEDFYSHLYMEDIADAD